MDVISVSQCNIFHLGHLCSSPFSIFCPTTWMYLYLCYLTKHSLNFSQSFFSLPLTWLTAHGCPLNLGVVLEPPTHIYTYIRMYSIYQGKITKDRPSSLRNSEESPPHQRGAHHIAAATATSAQQINFFMHKI